MSELGYMMKYKSPIRVEFGEVYQDIADKQDEMILRAVQKVGVFVDKNELVRALAYDRDQYKVGFLDGQSEAIRRQLTHGYWSDISGQAVLCSVCGKPQNAKQARGWRYCPHCGEVMECGI